MQKYRKITKHKANNPTNVSAQVHTLFSTVTVGLSLIFLQQYFFYGLLAEFPGSDAGNQGLFLHAVLQF